MLVTSSFYDPLSLDPNGSSTGWIDESFSPMPEPEINEGEAFFIVPTASENWIRSFSP
jgi:hypothetical protein